MPCSRGSSQLRDQTQYLLCLLHWQVGSLPLAPLGKPRKKKKKKKKQLHVDIYRSFIHNCQNLEETKEAFTGWIDKLWYIQTMEYYSEPKKKKKELQHPKKIWWKTEMHITQPVQKGYILCDSKYMTFRRSKTMWTTKRSFIGGERSE